MPATPTSTDRVTIHDLVRKVVYRRKLAPARVWRWTLADICMVLRGDTDQDATTTDSKAEQLRLCRELDERLALMNRLTVEQRIELEDWKSRLM